jgi:hypothetical protein
MIYSVFQLPIRILILCVSHVDQGSPIIRHQPTKRAWHVQQPVPTGRTSIVHVIRQIIWNVSRFLASIQDIIIIRPVVSVSALT